MSIGDSHRSSRLERRFRTHGDFTLCWVAGISGVVDCVDADVWEPDFLDNHGSLGESTGFVRADVGDTAKCFER